MNRFSLFLIALISSTIAFNQISEQKKECLDKFTDLKLPFTLEKKENNERVINEVKLPSILQEKVLQMEGYSKDETGLQVFAIGKVLISSDHHLLIYSTSQEPKAKKGKLFFAGIYSFKNGKIIDFVDFAYNKNDPESDLEELNSSIQRNGRSIVIKQELIIQEIDMTKKGIKHKKPKTYNILHTINHKGQIFKGSPQ